MSESTPFTASGLQRYDELPPAEAVARAWSSPGRHPQHHRKMQRTVEEAMPVLARALDRLATEVEGRA